MGGSESCPEMPLSLENLFLIETSPLRTLGVGPGTIRLSAVPTSVFKYDELYYTEQR